MNIDFLTSKRRGRSISYLLFTDWLIVVACFVLALHWRRYAPGLDIIDLAHRRLAPELITAMFYALLFLISFSVLDLYKRRTWLSPALHATAIAQGTAQMVLSYLLIRALTKWPVFTPSRHVILLWAAFTLPALLLHRLLVFPRLLQWASRSGLRRRVVLIGDSTIAHDFLHRWEKDRHAYPTLLPIGLITDKIEPLINNNLPKLGAIANLPELVETHHIEGAVITDPQLTYDQLMRLIEQCIKLFGWVDVHSLRASVWHRHLDTDNYFDIPFVRLSEVPHNPLYHIYKRVMDIALASLGGLLLAPLWLPVLVIVKLTSPGPVFYVRPRLGQGGRPFNFYKFRSMRADADQDATRHARILAHMKDETAVAHKVVNTTMITPIGRFIRKWAIDELPQLWNVIKGDMSLVGPRPLPQGEYDAQDEWQKKRFDVKPGCTGLWKIMVSREGGTTFANTVLYDIYYARNMNPLLDLYIIVQTVWVILRGRADG